MKCKVVSGALLGPLLALSGCGSVTEKQEQVDSVVKLQSEVLRKIVSLRGQNHIKDRIDADPILKEQEGVLLSGLESVINSQETFLSRKNKSEKK